MKQNVAWGGLEGKKDSQTKKTTRTETRAVKKSSTSKERKGVRL